MPEEVPALTGRTRTVVGVGVGLVVAAGLLLRFWTRSGLWLDEALDGRHRPPPAARDPQRAQARRRPAPLLLPPALLDRPLRAVQRRRALAVGGDRRAHAAGRLALRQALRRPDGGLDDARAAGQRSLRGVLRHRVAHVRAGHPADRLRLPGAATGGRPRPSRATSSRWPSWRPRCSTRSTGRCTSSAMVGIWLVASIVRTRRRGHPEDAPWAALIALAVGLPALRALGADVPLPDQAHRHARGPRRRTSPPSSTPSPASPTTRVRRCRPGRTRAACSPSSTSPCWRWPCSASG